MYGKLGVKVGCGLTARSLQLTNSMLLEELWPAPRAWTTTKFGEEPCTVPAVPTAASFPDVRTVAAAVRSLLMQLEARHGTRYESESRELDAERGMPDWENWSYSRPQGSAVRV